VPVDLIQMFADPEALARRRRNGGGGGDRPRVHVEMPHDAEAETPTLEPPAHEGTVS
jgi:hypothetical protein